MKSSPRVLIQVVRTVGFVGLLCTSAFAQIGQIDRSKLPQDAPVQSVYQTLLPIEQYARTYEANWRFPIPKADLASRLSLALQTLEEAQKQSPSNKELQLFTGLVAHFAYNLDIDAAYKPAMALLQPLAAEDFRAQWFLGVHQCQSNDAVGGMTNLLHVETLSDKLPRAFWQDYANCAVVAAMPVHAVRAYDNAEKSPDGTSIDTQLEQIAQQNQTEQFYRVIFQKTGVVRGADCRSGSLHQLSVWRVLRNENYGADQYSGCGQRFVRRHHRHRQIP